MTTTEPPRREVIEAALTALEDYERGGGKWLSDEQLMRELGIRRLANGIEVKHGSGEEENAGDDWAWGPGFQIVWQRGPAEKDGRERSAIPEDLIRVVIDYLESCNEGRIGRAEIGQAIVKLNEALGCLGQRSDRRTADSDD